MSWREECPVCGREMTFESHYRLAIGDDSRLVLRKEKWCDGCGKQGESCIVVKPKDLFAFMKQIERGEVKMVFWEENTAWFVDTK